MTRQARSAVGQDRLEAYLPLAGGLHELDGCAVRIANINDALPGVRARFEGLRLASGLPTGRCNRAQHCIKIVYRKGHMERSDIARSEVGTRPIRWGVVLQQFNLVSRSLKNGD